MTARNSAVKIQGKSSLPIPVQDLLVDSSAFSEEQIEGCERKSPENRMLYA